MCLGDEKCRREIMIRFLFMCKLMSPGSFVGAYLLRKKGSRGTETDPDQIY